MSKLNKWIRSIIPVKLKKFVAYSEEVEYVTHSYSQFGEDMILKKYFENKIGFYVDVGAHHPLKYSNTFYFYKLGWRGINIDALPGSKQLFDKYRRRDINIEVGISDVPGETEYHMFTQPLFNTFSKDAANKIDKSKYPLIGIERILVERLDTILDDHLPSDTSIDLLSIDVEGRDIEVLKSNNWTKYKPKFILVESHNVNLNSINQNDIYQFLTAKNYTLVAATHLNLFFQQNIEA